MENTRRKFLQYSSLGLSSLMLSPYANGFPMKNDFSVGGFETLRENVGYFTGAGGTIGWLVNSDGIAVIDAQFPDTVNELISEIQKKSARKINFLINTHHHGDHTAGNIAFKGIVENICAHENSKANQIRVAKKRKIEDQQLYPNMVFAKKWTTQLGNETISCTYHGEGHTDGDIITHFENANIVHMGDLVFNRKYPYIDKSAGANINSWIDILDKATTNFDKETIFILGHAEDGYKVTGTKEDINAFKNYLEKLIIFMAAQVKSGKSLEEIKTSSNSIPGATEWKGKGIGRSLDAAFQELTE